jgi:UDP-GlcNAc3NAcA epimerase
MYDNSIYYSKVANEKTTILNRLGLENKEFILATIHRNNNTDIPERLNTLFETLLDISEDSLLEIVLPIHPRTRKMMNELLDSTLIERLKHSKLTITEPASFFEMIVLEQHAKLVITDSGGVQKEAYFFNKPCIILRPETEWVELVENGTARICDADPQKIKDAFHHFNNHENLQFPPVFGDGNAARFILEQLLANRPNQL